MAAVAHNPAFAKRVGISQKVGKDFVEADKSKKFKTGGAMSKEREVAKYFAKKGHKRLAAHEEREAAGKEKDTKAIAKREEAALKGAPKSLREYEKKEHKEMGFKRGGSARVRAPRAPRRRAAPVDPAALASMLGPMSAGPGAMPGMAHGGGVHHHHYYLGGSVKRAAGGAISTPTVKPTVESMITRKSSKHGRDGAAVRGKTKGAEPKMARGGHVKHHARGGGIESRGKTRGKIC